MVLRLPIDKESLIGFNCTKFSMATELQQPRQLEQWIVKEALRREIGAAKLPPTWLDIFAPSRKGCCPYGPEDALGHLNDPAFRPREYARGYPWTILPANVFAGTAENRGHYELVADGSFRFYVHEVGPDGYRGESIRSLISKPLPKDTDFLLLKLQALEFVRSVRRMLGKGIKLCEGVPLDGLQENLIFVKSSTA